GALVPEALGLVVEFLEGRFDFLQGVAPGAGTLLQAEEVENPEVLDAEHWGRPGQALFGILLLVDHHVEQPLNGRVTLAVPVLAGLALADDEQRVAGKGVEWFDAAIVKDGKRSAFRQRHLALAWPRKRQQHQHENAGRTAYADGRNDGPVGEGPHRVAVPHA